MILKLINIKKICTIIATLVVAVSLSACYTSDTSWVYSTWDALNLKKALDDNNMTQIKEITDKIYNGRETANSESLMMELAGIFTLMQDCAQQDKDSTVKEYINKYYEVYEILKNKKDFQKDIEEDKELKTSFEFMEFMIEMISSAIEKKGADETSPDEDSIMVEKVSE